MRYTMTFLEETYSALTDHLFHAPQVEQAAYLLCKVSRHSRETRFLAKELIPIPPEHLLVQHHDLLSIPSKSFVPILKRANDSVYCFFLVHSHPEYCPDFSKADDTEEPKLFRSAYIRIKSSLHGSLVFSSPSSISARVWIEDADSLAPEPIDMIRIIGRRYQVIKPNNSRSGELPPPGFFDRQVRTFGPDVQKLLGRLTVGVVGCGGTGSAVIELLVRIGVGKLIVFDHDKVESTNITRIHGSGIGDVGRLKVEVMRDMANGIGTGTTIEVAPHKIIQKTAAEKLKECDIILGCTDDHAGRSILNQLMIRYYIPVIDVGVLIDSAEGKIRNIVGRVTLLKPGKPCLYCRNRINATQAAAEMMPPDVYAARRNEGYAPELHSPDPAVVTFTTSVASQAVTEMLNWFTQFMDGHDCPELLLRFDSRKIMLYPEPAMTAGCPCGSIDLQGCGDESNFLGMIWPQDQE